MDVLLIQLAKPWVWLKLGITLVAVFAVWRLGHTLLRVADQYVRDDLIRVLKGIWLVFSIFAFMALGVHAIYLPSVPILFDAGSLLLQWSKNTLGQLIAIVAFSLVAWKLIEYFASHIVPGDEFNRRTVRIQTLRDVVESTLRVAIVLVAFIAILQSLGINATTLLAGVSVLGVAVGFGAQSLIKDVFNGFFILLEDQYGVGDVISVNNSTLGGTVEKLNLRVTTLRTLDGTLNVVPNGQIQTVSVSSKDWSRVVAEVDISYEANINDGLRILQEVAQKLYEDPQWHDNYLSEPEIQGVVDLGDNAVTLRALFTVQPKTQYALGREFKRRIKIAMDKAGIAIPYPQRSLNLSETPINIRLLRETESMTQVQQRKQAQSIEDMPVKPSETRDPEDDRS